MTYILTKCFDKSGIFFLISFLLWKSDPSESVDHFRVIWIEWQPVNGQTLLPSDPISCSLLSDCVSENGVRKMKLFSRTVTHAESAFRIKSVDRNTAMEKRIRYLVTQNGVKEHKPFSAFGQLSASAKSDTAADNAYPPQSDVPAVMR